MNGDVVSIELLWLVTASPTSALLPSVVGRHKRRLHQSPRLFKLHRARLLRRRPPLLKHQKNLRRRLR